MPNMELPLERAINKIFHLFFPQGSLAGLSDAEQAQMRKVRKILVDFRNQEQARMGTEGP